MRYRDECARLLQVMEAQLAGSEYMVGEYSIADIVLYSWVVPVYRACWLSPSRRGFASW